MRQVDSSLLDEWERLRHPEVDDAIAAPGPTDPTPPPVTANRRAFGVLVRNALFRRVELVARRDWAQLADLEARDEGNGAWDALRWEEAMVPYWEEHATVGIDADARIPRGRRSTRSRIGGSCARSFSTRPEAWTGASTRSSTCVPPTSRAGPSCA